MRAALLPGLLSLSCATHVGVEPADPRAVGRELSRNAELRLPEGRAKQQMKRVPTGLDNMTPGDWFLETLAGMPLAPGVTARSIVAVRGGAPYEEGDDGLVRTRAPTSRRRSPRR